jgi:hypothetical protein
LSCPSFNLRIIQVTNGSNLSSPNTYPSKQTTSACLT